MSEGSPTATSSRFRLTLLVVLSALLVAAVAAVVFVLTTRDVDALGLDGGEVSQREDRGTVQSQAQQFMLRLNTYGPDLLDDKGQMPDYRASVEELLTAKFRDSFLQSVTFAEQTVVEGAARTGVVYATGVSTIDDDSATVIVAGSFTGTYQSDEATEPVSADPVGYRVIVTLVKTQGRWLIDLYTPEPEPGQPTSIPVLPSTDPTDPAAPTDPAPTSAPPATPTEDPTAQPSTTTLPPLPATAPTAAPTAAPTTAPAPTGGVTP